MPRIFDKIRRIAAIRKSSGTIHLTNFSPCVIICLPLCYMAFSYNMTTVVKQLKVWRGAQLASPLSAVACSLFPIGLGVRNFALRSLRGHPLSSALPLGRGLFHRFGRIFCNLLRRLSLAYRSPLAVLFCSAPPLGCGSVHRFKRLVWASLRLSERSRTIGHNPFAANLHQVARLTLLGSI